MLENAYYEALKPLHYFEPVGCALSNTWVGRSRVIDRVYEARVAAPGDRFATLVGGNFVVTAERGMRQASFWLPKHVFEKSYGPANSAAGLFEGLAGLGVVARVEAFGTSSDFAAARASAEREFPEHHPRLLSSVRSPALDALIEHSESVCAMARRAGFKVLFDDFGEDRRARLVIREPSPTAGHSSPGLRVSLREEGHAYVERLGDPGEQVAFVERLWDLDEVMADRVYGESMWVRDIRFLENERFLNEAALAFEQASPTGTRRSPG